ncbi:hypothetical protein HDU96_003131, partial [Phlyctochytrium bullatum]
TLREDDEMELEIEQGKKMEKAQEMVEEETWEVKHMKAMNSVYEIANDYAASAALTLGGKSKTDDSKVDDVITHTEVLILVMPEKKEKQTTDPAIDVALAPNDDGVLGNAKGLPTGVGSTPGKPQEKKRNHGVPPDSKLRQPTTPESDKYRTINVGNGKRNESAKLIDKVDDVKAIITVLCLLEACLRWMIVAYYLTVLLAADYYLEKLSK